MANDLEQMLKNQLQNNIVYRLDSATQAGDIQAARKAALELSEFQAKNRPADVPSFTNADIRTAIKAKAPWFGVDPRRSAKVVEFGKNMEPASFKSAEEFADKVIEAIEEEYEEGDEEEDDGPEEKEVKKPERKKTDAPSSSGARAIPRRSAGPWSKLSDAPKEIADTIKASADKFTRNATKEQRDKYISTALGTAYNADLRAKGRK
jgi:hypothetical protein